MELKEIIISGVFEVQLPFSEDDRGDFVKTLHVENFASSGLAADFKESYYSTSKAGVVRGMHFQTPPYDHEKLVYCVGGTVTDVLLDLRKGSETYGQHCAMELAKSRRNAVYIPKGVAHGFCVKQGEATLVYMTTTVYHQDSDTGVLWNSFGFEWPVSNPSLSDRDQSFVALEEFESPF